MCVEYCTTRDRFQYDMLHCTDASNCASLQDFIVIKKSYKQTILPLSSKKFLGIIPEQKASRIQPLGALNVLCYLLTLIKLHPKPLNFIVLAKK